MCGIAGFVVPSPAASGESVLRRMTDSIRHRGPDDSGFFTNGRVFLGHRRLSIVDLAGGHQPMTDESSARWIVYNGEVFNHADLRPDLERAGHVYSSRCDTETILHAYEEYGPDCVSRFRGMFAFAIWDQPTQTLFCARDRLGIKPFYYFWDGQLFAFASEIKALLEHPQISAAMDESQLGEYLAFGYLSSDRTMFRNIRKLMPGHRLTLSVGDGEPRLSIERYWDVPEPSSQTSSSDDSFWIAETRRRLEETVRMRLMSDVPLGVFLSGGVDSSAIAALVKRMVTGSVQTFSVGYEEAAQSELDSAARVASMLETDHHEVRIGLEDFFGVLPRLIWHEDEPISWPSSVSLHFVAQLAASRVKVVLTGEGSDELFGGYERYRWNQINQQAVSALGFLPTSMRQRLRAMIASSTLIKASLRRKLRHTALGREESLESLYLDNFYCAFSAADQRKLCRAEPGDVYASFHSYWDSNPRNSLLERMLYADQKTYLVELLMKQDQMSMSTSIESRVPFLDHTFVEFAAGIPSRMKIRGGTQKYVLKKSIEDLLPADIIHRKKMGFPTPLRDWLRHPRLESTLASLSSPDSFLAQYLDMGEVQGLLERHKSGFEDSTDRIWRLLNLEIWGQLFITGKRDRQWAGALSNELVH
jgi:asparagine synthase (glutamine-hydrolysing)